MSNPHKLYTTVKNWNRYSEEARQEITKRYDVIFTDHKTKRERVRSILSRINRKDLDRAIDKLNKGIDGFSKAVSASDQPAFDESKFRDVLYGNNKTDVSKLFWGEKSFKL